MVDNSSTQDFECNNVKVIHTEPYHIPKAYNKATNISKGKYLDEQRIQLDNRLLKNFYLNKGYYNVKIKNTFFCTNSTNIQ